MVDRWYKSGKVGGKNPTHHYALKELSRYSYIRVLLRVCQCFSHPIGTAVVPCLYVVFIVYLCFTGFFVFCYILRHIHSSRKDIG